MGAGDAPRSDVVDDLGDLAVRLAVSVGDTFTARCFEGDGTPQIATESPISPSGATGLDRVTRML